MNLIECTIRIKEEARAHYERLATSVTDKDMKRIFTLLAAAEEEHVRMLREMIRSTAAASSNGFGLDANVCSYKPKIDSSNIHESLLNDPDAYRHVSREEKEAIGFFEKLANGTSDETMKKLCMRLADQEREHLSKIENIYSFVEDPWTYLEWGEFSNIKTL